MGVESSSDTQPPVVLFCFWFVAEMKEFVLFTLGLGERRMVTRPTLVKNFCAWLRICTAVLVPMCSARTHERTEKKSVSACPRPDEERPTAQRQRERPTGRPVRTLYAAPCATVQLQGLQEPAVLVLRPLLPLLRDRVRLPRLVGQASVEWKKQSENTRSDRSHRFCGDAAAIRRCCVPWARAPPLTNPCRRD